MKINFSIFLRVSLLILFMILQSSCSLFAFSKRSSLKNNASKQKSSLIPRAQYNDLKKRFDLIAQENKRLKANLSPNERTDYLKRANVNDDKEIPLQSINANGLEETVDLFEAGQSTIPLTKKQGVKLNDQEIQKQLTAITDAQGLISRNELDKAMSKLKSIESSSFLPMVAWAKYLIGEIMFKQNEYDLAMQLYEEVLYKYSESSVVLPSLKKLIVCTSKLKLIKKNKKYNSYYYDLFGMKN